MILDVVIRGYIELSSEAENTRATTVCLNYLHEKHNKMLMELHTIIGYREMNIPDIDSFCLIRPIVGNLLFIIRYKHDPWYLA